MIYVPVQNTYNNFRFDSQRVKNQTTRSSPHRFYAGQLPPRWLNAQHFVARNVAWSRRYDLHGSRIHPLLASARFHFTLGLTISKPGLLPVRRRLFVVTPLYGEMKDALTRRNLECSPWAFGSRGELLQQCHRIPKSPGSGVFTAQGRRLLGLSK
jgi:hypothetical protein